MDGGTKSHWKYLLWIKCVISTKNYVLHLSIKMDKKIEQNGHANLLWNKEHDKINDTQLHSSKRKSGNHTLLQLCVLDNKNYALLKYLGYKNKIHLLLRKSERNTKTHTERTWKGQSLIIEGFCDSNYARD